VSSHWPQLPKPARRPARWTLIIVALVAVVYEVAFNAFLLSGGLSRVLNADPDSLLVTYRLGWSIVPGYVHARGLRIRSKDNGVEFDLRIERCAFHVVLHELAARRFHVTHVGGDGISFIARLRITPDMATQHTLEEIPQIEGLEQMPVKGPDKPPPDDAHYNLWTVALDDVVAESVHEVWIQAFRYVGDARVVGGFYLRPTRWAHVGPPATAFFRGGRVTTAGYVVASEVTGRIDAVVDPFDPRVTGGIDVFRKGSGRILLDLTIPNVEFAQRWVGESGVRVEGGAGAAQTDVRIDHGRLAPGTRFAALLRAVKVMQEHGSVTGDVDLSASEARDDGVDRFDATAAARDANVVVSGYETVPVRVPRAEVAVHAKGVDFVDRPLADASVAMRLPQSDIPDVRIARAFLGGGDSGGIEGGKGNVGAELDIDDGVGRGRALVAIDDARFAFGKNTSVLGNVRAEVDLRRWTLSNGRADLAGSRVEVLGVRAPGSTDNWWANVKLASGTLDPNATPVWHSQVVAEARDTRPFVAMFVDASSLPPWLVPLLTSNDLHVRGALSAGREGIDLREGVASAGPLRAEATLAKRGDATTGVALLASGALAVGIELRDGGASVQLAGVDDWYRKKVGK
jgi:hypothetical protein